jgi:iron complex outermembrane recepter protein
MRFKHFLRSAASIGILAAYTTDILAQAEGSALETIVVTAQKYAEPAQQTPISMTVVTAQDLIDRSISNFTDVQWQVPGLNFEQTVSTQFGTNVSMRGLTSTGSGESPVGIYADGVYESAVNASANNASLAQASIIDIDRIEVLKGPQGTLYGRNSTGGAINIISKLPTWEDEAQFTLGYGNYDSKVVQAIINHPLTSDTLSFRVAAQWSDNSGYSRDLEDGRNLDNATVGSFRVTLLYTPTQQLSFALRGDYANGIGGNSAHQPIAITPTSAAEIALENGLPLTPAGIAAAFALYAPYTSGTQPNLHDRYYNTNPYASFTSGGESLTASYDFAGNLSLKSISAYRRSISDGNQDVDATPFNILSSFQGSVMDQFTQEIQLNGNFLEDRLKLVSGAYYYHLRQDENNSDNALVDLLAGTGANPNYTITDRHDTSGAAYGQTTYAIAPDLSIAGGLRWTSEDKTLNAQNYNAGGCQVPVADRIDGTCLGEYKESSDNVSYTAIVNYDVSSTVMVYAKNSTGFKSGGINDGSITPGSYGSFAPERVNDYEAGVKSEWFDRHLRLNISGYLGNYTDLQRTVVQATPSGGVNILVQNAAKARIEGMEFEAIAQPVGNLLLELTSAYVDPKYLVFRDATGDLSGQKFEDQPKWTYSLTTAYTQPMNFGLLRGELDWTWRAMADLYPSGAAAAIFHSQPAYGLLNARLSTDLTDQKLELALWAKNLTDKHYWTVITDLTSNLGMIVGDVGPPLTVGLQLTKRF